MRLPIRGRLSVDSARDIVAADIRITGWLFRWLLGISGAISHGVMFGALLFGIAGTTDWPRAWVFIAVWAVNVLVVCVVSSTEVIVERLWPLKDIRYLDRGDRAFVLLLGPVAAAWLVIIPIEAQRLELTDPPPLSPAIAGFVLVNVGWIFMTLAVRQNRFASTVVKVQRDRHHEVVDRGVYKVVRHPMYFGASLLAIGAPLLLGSYIALGLSAIGIVGLVQRIRVEERVLREGLAGYADYTTRVRHRLVPYVW